MFVPRKIKQGSDPKDLVQEIRRKHPQLDQGDIHEEAGDHFKQLSRELWEREGPPTPPRHEKKAGVAGYLGHAMAGEGRLGQIGARLVKHEDLIDNAGLGILALDPAYEAVHELRKPKEERDYHNLARSGAELGGLGVLASSPMAKMMGAKHASLFSCVDELNKLGESSNISDEDARRSLDRLETLERNKPTAGQVGRYAALGAAAGPAVGAISNVIKGRHPLNFSTAEGVGKLRGVLGESAKGALSMGAVPLVRGGLDRRGEEKKLRKYIHQHDHSASTDSDVSHGHSEMAKAAAAEVFDELQALLADPEFLKTASTEEIAELAKLAISMAGIRGGIANVAGKVSPTLNKPVMQAAQEGAHALQQSPNSFVQGMGNVLHHKAQSPGKMFLGAANPVGTAAEVVAGGAGNAAAKGLAAAGGGMQSRFGTSDPVVQQGRAMTPMGRAQNALGSAGGALQRTFSPGGMGHNVATKYMPQAAEIGGAVGAGLALHAPVGLAGALGKGFMAGAGQVAPALAAHAPAALQGAVGAIGGAAKGLARGAAGHLAEDVIGTGKQGLIGQAAGRLGGGAAKTVARSLAPGAMHSMLPGAMGAMSAIPKAAPLPTF